MTEGIEGIIHAVDSWWGVVALMIVGLYALLWKFGDELLGLMRTNGAIAREARDDAAIARAATESIQESIITNHGSKNLGDAIDRLTGWMIDHISEAEKDSEKIDVLEVRSAMDSLSLQRLGRIQERNSEAIALLSSKVDQYINENAELIQYGWDRLAEQKAAEDALRSPSDLHIREA